MVVEIVGLEALTLHGEQIRQNRRPMVLTDTFPQRVVADGGEAGQEVPAVGVLSVGREARSMVEAGRAEVKKGRKDYGW